MKKIPCHVRLCSFFITLIRQKHTFWSTSFHRNQRLYSGMLGVKEGEEEVWCYLWSYFSYVCADTGLVTVMNTRFFIHFYIHLWWRIQKPKWETGKSNTFQALLLTDLPLTTSELSLDHFNFPNYISPRTRQMFPQKQMWRRENKY